MPPLAIIPVIMRTKMCRGFIATIIVYTGIFASASCMQTVKESDPELNLFCETFIACRQMFLKASEPWTQQNRGAGIVTTLSIPTTLSQGWLPVDVLELPATKTPSNLVVIASGVHGAEAYTGSSLQTLLMNQLLPAIDRSSTTIILIHILNPWGALTGRRVTENNVDLNRNFTTDHELFRLWNPAYDAISPVVNPTHPVNDGWIPWTKFYSQALSLWLKTPMGELRRALLRGQYQFPNGVYYGGSKPEPVVMPIKQYFSQRLNKNNFQKILLLDIHTGYGARGHMHLMPNPLRGNRLVVERAEAIMKATVGHYKIEDAVNDPDFYDSTGDFSSFLADLATARGILAIPLLLEFGTLDSQTLTGSLKSLHRIVRENQLHHYGTENLDAERTVTSQFRDMFFPQDAAWRAQVIRQFMAVAPDFIRRFQNAND